ncbi:MAG: radical SAM protein [Planctomycetota bacterium]
MTAPGAVYPHLYGPVPSRRLGLSLGVDIVPFKVCSYNCVYCQLGRTPATTTTRGAYEPVAAVLDEVRRKVAEPGFKADWITLGGSGEPTLHSGIGRLIAGIKALTAVPVAVLTNGSLFHDPAVRRDVAEADLLLPTLTASSAAVFNRIHRPHPGMDFAAMCAGLEALAREYKGRVWLEVFLVPGMNTDPAALADLKVAVGRIKPERIHLNTAVRPPAEAGVRAMDRAELERVRAFFGPGCEVIAEPPVAAAPAAGTATASEILGFLERRPGTVADLAEGLGREPEAVRAVLKQLAAAGRVRAAPSPRGEAYMFVRE